MTSERRDDMAARAEALSAEFVESVANTTSADRAYWREVWLKPPKDEWRDKLGPKDRQAERPTQQDRYARQRAIHAAYEERAQKSARA